MTTSTRLLHGRRFLPLFVTQLLNAFNDNLYKTAMVLFVVYSVYNDEAQEAQFSAIASGVFIAPFFLLSAMAGQLADMRDKARIIRIVKAAEIAIMAVGAAGLMIAWQDAECVKVAGQCLAGAPHPGLSAMAIPLLLTALFAMGVHSTFFGPIKYAILPQHLERDEVLSGTGLVEAGTYIAILFGTILAGWIPVEIAAAGIVLTALVGYVTSRQIPSAPPQGEIVPLDWNVFTSSARLIRASPMIQSPCRAMCRKSMERWMVTATFWVPRPTAMASRPSAISVCSTCSTPSSVRLMLLVFSSAS